MALDFAKIRTDVGIAATAAFNDLKAEHPDEQFYAFALYTDDGVAGISAAANTEEGLKRAIAKYGFTGSADINYLRWSTSEWAYEGIGWEHLKDSYHRIMAVAHPDDEAFLTFRERILCLMIEVLADMDADGVFGHGAERERVTLLCSITDSDDMMALLETSVHHLNPPAVVARYEATRMGQ